MKHSTRPQKGFSLIEAMVATAIFGIGFVGTYSLVAFSERSMRQSVIKQKLQMQADQILNVIESDLDNIAQYNLDLTVCNVPTTTDKFDERPYEWCLRMNGELGAATATQERSVAVTTLAGGENVVHIVLEAGADDAQIVMKRVF